MKDRSGSREEPTRLRRVVFIMLTFLVSVVVLIGAMEGAAHFVDRRHGFAAWHDRSISYVEDDEVDWVAERRQYAWTTIDRFHFRGPEVTPDKPEGVFRIAALGGSSTFEIGKTDDETWPSLLQERLRATLGPHVEVFNAATPGYSTWQSSRLLQGRVLDWDPDLVLVYHLANDSVYFRHADRQAVIDGWKLNARANYIGAIAHEPYPPLAVPSTIAPRTVDFLRVQLVRRRIRGTRAESHAFWIDQTLSGRVEDAGIGFYEENLDAMVEALRQRGTPLAVISQVSLLRPDNSQLERDEISYEYRGLTHERLVSAYEMAWALNREIAERNDHVFLVPAHEHVPATFEFLSDGVHLTPKGSETLAGFVAEQLVQLGIVQ